MKPDRSGPEEEIERLEEIQARLASLDLRAFEQCTEREAYDELRPGVLEVVASALDILTGLGAALPQDGLLSAALDVGLTECEHYRRRLLSLDPGQACWVVVVECAALSGRVSRLVHLTVFNLKKDAGHGTAEHRAGILKSSLAVRRSYAKLTSLVAEAEPPPPYALGIELRVIGTQMAKMVGQPTFALLWPGDRLAIRAFQQRIVTWLQAPNLEEGRHLWVDLRGLVEILRQVSRREELIAHDAEFLDQLRREILGRPDSGPVSLADRLAPVFGLDERLDRLITERAELSHAEWLELIDATEARMRWSRA